ncbi:6-phosphogluconolactonase [Lysobacter solisilvae (ex Woo and Kim 2020)]|uniref:6-phosphogluconolactonase n=1 Tax=Agrilutibacter terrestris TaxID=2865112 RepID=A0A7H0FU61_9GAMM|nr:6-phosphogluconolactonase [Lysobacter terrestris]QNP39577.1 6-phosphogluconolactonase [Lysobacter terrestris]
MAWIEHRYPDAAALAAALAARLEDVLREAIASRGHAMLALAGGRTPFPAYRALAARALDWRKVVLMPTDERCVPHDHPACNLREMREAFASAQGVRFASLTVDDGDPGRSAVHASTLLSQHAGTFDAVVLGMGNDAHTASLFPGAANLAAALDPLATFDACRIDPRPLPPEAPFPRITLTVARLLRARGVHLALVGAGKRAVLREAQAARDPLRQPVAAILDSPAAVHIHWSE